MIEFHPTSPYKIQKKLDFWGLHRQVHLVVAGCFQGEIRPRKHRECDSVEFSQIAQVTVFTDGTQRPLNDLKLWVGVVPLPSGSQHQDW